MARTRNTRPDSGFEVPEETPAPLVNPNAAASANQAPAAPSPPPSASPSEAGPRGGGKLNPAADHQAPPITAAMFATTERYRVSMALERLRKLAQVNADVAWLLDQYHGFKKALKP